MSDAAQRLAQRWGYEARPPEIVPLVVVASVALVGALVVFTAGRLVSPPYGIVFLLAWGALVTWWITSRGRAALRSAQRVEIGADKTARISALAEALARDAGVPMTRLEVVAGAHPNALIAPGVKPVIAVTEGAAVSLGRTELEALLAHSLIRVSGWRGLAAAASVALGPLAPRSTESSLVCDLAAVAVTRYPPALISVLEKADDRGGRFGAFWLRGRSRVHPDVTERIAGLKDL